MRRDRTLRVVLCSGGRRVYLVRWFREAFARVGVPGEVVVLDADPGSAAAQHADVFRQVPPVTDDGYGAAVVAVVAGLRADLVLSVHDYELELLATDLAARLRRDGATVLALGPHEQLVAGDKWLLASQLDGDYATATVLASDEAGVARLTASCERLVVKHRYGSGSSGLALVDHRGLRPAVERAASTAPRPVSAGAVDSATDWVVVQPLVDGVEYGLDAVFSIHGSPTGTPAGVSARRKLRMRGGETDQAVTVDATGFQGAAHAVGALLSPRGIVDMDVVVDPTGRQHVIDVNPRFGGGYPFSHLAGADVPAFFVAELVGDERPERYLAGVSGVAGSKFEEVTMVRSGGAS